MTIRLFINTMLIALLCCCTQVRKTEYAALLHHPEDAHPAPIAFSTMKNRLPIGIDLGIYRPTCGIQGQKIGNSFFTRIDQWNLDDTFSRMLETQGYDVVDRLGTILDEEYEDELLRSEYKVGAKLANANLDVCSESDNLIVSIFSNGTNGMRGEMFLEIEWAIYDSLRRKVAYKTKTTGYAELKSANADGLSIILSEAFGMAAHNLGADSNFHDLIFYGTNPPSELRKKTPHNKTRPRIYDAQENVVINNPPLSNIKLQDHIDTSRNVAVLVQTSQGHGSGYFITKQGHIITNSHVVGDARRVRIVTSGRKDKLVAEVLRSDKARDVALLKLEELPDDLEITTLPIKTKWPSVSEDIYALGAPANTRMQDTLTKGIVSSHRKNFRVFGTKMDFIQGDVQIIGGNSGGPLLDANGNIVGISVAAMHVQEGESNSGLNLFIPIESALERLNIELK